MINDYLFGPLGTKQSAHLIPSDGSRTGRDPNWGAEERHVGWRNVFRCWLFRPNPIVETEMTLMIRKLGTASITVTALAILFAALPVRAQFTPDLQRRTTS